MNLASILNPKDFRQRLNRSLRKRCGSEEPLQRLSGSWYETARNHRLGRFIWASIEIKNRTVCVVAARGCEMSE